MTDFRPTCVVWGPRTKRTVPVSEAIKDESQAGDYGFVVANSAERFWAASATECRPAGHTVCTRLLSKLAAHTLCIYLNRVLGNPNWLQIKALAFPN
jgi:hypothetical protein